MFGSLRTTESKGEAGWRALADLGHAMADGCRNGDGRIAAAIRSIEEWGERRMLSFCLSDLRARSPEPIASSPAHIACDSSPDAEALARAVETLGGEGTWAERSVAALRSASSELPWDLAAWVGSGSWQVVRGSDAVREVPADGLARSLGQPGAHDLLASPTLRRHPERVLLDLVEAFTAQVAGGSLVGADEHEAFSDRRVRRHRRRAPTTTIRPARRSPRDPSC